MTRRLVRLFVAAAKSVLSPAIALALRFHPHVRIPLGELSGRSVPRFGGDCPMWFHAASVGDVRALQPLINRARARGVPIILSCWTRHGRSIAATTLPELTIVGPPLDWGPAVRRFLRRTRPSMLVLEALELWPSWIDACRRFDIPVVIVNGRVSPRSARWYRRLAAVFQPCFAALEQVIAVDATQARRFVDVGVRDDRVALAPTSKHADVRGVFGQIPCGDVPRVVLASVHQREEDQLFAAIEQLMRMVPRLRATVVPRYPRRAPAVVRKLSRLGIASELTSRTVAGAEPECAVTVCDVMGGLVPAYRGATLAVVGGSFSPHGGHNIVEAVAAGLPVIVGPHLENCANEARVLIRTGIVIQVARGSEVVAAARGLLDVEVDPGVRAATTRALEDLGAGADVIDQHLRRLQERRSPAAG